MALEQKLAPRLQQKLVMTPALQLAIKLLQLNRLDLEQTLQQEMVDNPVLEESEERVIAEATEDRSDEGDSDRDDQVIDNLDVDSFFEKYFDSQPTTANMSERSEAPPFENTLTSTETLTDHLMWQLEMTVLAADQFELCQAVVGNLDPDGYLRADAAELAEMTGSDGIAIERALARVQALDPPGVAGRDLRECLFLQLERIGLDDSLAAKIVLHHLDALTAHRFKDIAKGTRTDLDAVADAVAVIRALNPRPGQAYSGESARYIVPDVFVRKDDGEYVISVNDDGLPRLRVSRLYRDMLSGKEVSKDASDYLQDKMRSALWLIKSFGQRQRTIQKVAESIVAHQRGFLDHGVTALRPMVLRDVAEDIEMHESTVSRVVNGKYMHTPQGIFEMKFFFHSGLGHSSGSDVSSVSVKEKIKRLVDTEDAHKPLSDAALAKRLKEGGLQIARRTVAKYREELGIQASKARRAIR